MARIKIEGKQIGWLTVLEKMPYAENSHRAMYKCRCQCGNEDVEECPVSSCSLQSERERVDGSPVTPCRSQTGGNKDPVIPVIGFSFGRIKRIPLIFQADDCAPELFPDPGVNVIFGENGQGKTNIIESIWMFTGCHSFRTHKHTELIEKGQREAKVSLSFTAHGMDNDARLSIQQKREFMLNGTVKESPRRFLGEFQSVVFSPTSLSIVQDAPAERRNVFSAEKDCRRSGFPLGNA